MPTGFLYKKANIEGENWLKRNESSLQLIEVPHKIFRWDSCLLHDQFNKCLERVNVAYKECKNFHRAIHDTIDEFVVRYSRRFSIKNKEKAKYYCLQYLLEETAIIMIMWQNREYNYIIYPGEINKALDAGYSKFVAPVYTNLLKWVGVYVRTRSNYKEDIMSSNNVVYSS